jgi:hypothetical protein
MSKILLCASVLFVLWPPVTGQFGWHTLGTKRPIKTNDLGVFAKRRQAFCQLLPELPLGRFHALQPLARTSA